MDFDKFRSQWSDPEYRKSLPPLDLEPISVIIERCMRRERREKRWRATCRIMLSAPLAIVLGLEAVRHFVTESRPLPSQTVAVILELAVVFALNLLDKVREIYKRPKYWLTPGEFLLDEPGRLKKIIRFDQWHSVLVCLAIICLAVYAAPLLSAGLQVALWIVTGAAVLVRQIYDFRKISQLKQERDNYAADLDELAADDFTETDL
jgi:hypothetical protein